MLILPSDFSEEELTSRFDEYTGPARFAGNDDTMDLIFVSERKKNKIKLIRRARTVRDPFAAVFRGRIMKTENGSEIRGFFTKSVFDFIFMLLIDVLLLFVQIQINQRGDNPYVINVLLVTAIVISLLVLTCFRRTKRIYADFLMEITGKSIVVFPSLKEKRDMAKEEEKNTNGHKSPFAKK